MPKLEQFEIKKYWQIFCGLKPVENKVSHDQVKPILYNSKQDSSILNKIWFLADIDDDDMLDFEEFVICMRLLFDLINNNISTVPDVLPDWLIPGSKAKLIKQKRSNNPVTSTPKEEETKKAREVDWYISPNDLKVYNDLLTKSTLTDGSFTFSSLSIIVNSNPTHFINVSNGDIEKTWKLVNPKNSTSINKDPAMYFLHILKQNSDLNAAIPNSLPSRISNIIDKSEISYKVDSVPRTETTTRTSNTTNKNASVVKSQFENLLNYKKMESSSKSIQANVRVDSVIDDLQNIEKQVDRLESYLSTKKNELNSINNQINQLK
ncbi:hypothetical protein KAFR_0J00750 [Kazachstania africana CBS 2517]|uniref:Actin cytoskeleton-regulatory complex protein END3 n=1 Tax=Kazachstania africana (strain ATCC 22294 / BCRC 22015 / CBS 2517 / CECT 1963 / NBRC 1671 / NRRL Y-8276) TaxID=1071382 RepID=H2B0J3_KAZAF|nr:hypothetical protein KAFR_0J00750 [Kazachstania africana CBS 2517]CCF60143.1 hypothetical protein KAFR_0J00750 [Kazachstania africana CBS 2517]